MHAWLGGTTIRYGMGVILAVVVLGGAGGCATQETQKRADGYFKEGLALLRSDRQRAFISFQKSIQENPQHQWSHYYLGHLYARQGKFKEAEQELNHVIVIDPKNSAAHTYRGQVLTQLGRWDEAIQSYRAALMNPLYDTPDLARFHLGRALAHQGEMDEAIDTFHDALVVSPPTVPREAVYLELGRAYSRIGKNDQAREALQHVTALDTTGAYADSAGALMNKLKP